MGVAARLGVRKVRLTGGEPLLRRDVPRLVEMLSSIEAIDDIALTTNGLLLARHAAALKRAGLDRVTVSLDTLEEELFRSIADTRAPLARVMRGIDAAREAGLEPVKVNMVVRRGVNDGCVLEMAEHFRGRPEILRFIEFMDVGESNGWRREEVLPATGDPRRDLRSAGRCGRSPRDRQEGVASRWAYEDGAGEIGVISSVSEPFCHGCTRARLSADGQALHVPVREHRKRHARAAAGRCRRRGARGAPRRDLDAAAATATRSSAPPPKAAPPMPRPTAACPRGARARPRSERRPRVEMSYIGG